MPSDYHRIDCFCPKCCAADNRRKGPNRFLLSWICVITGCVALWAWIIAPIAVAIIPALAL